MIGPGNSRIGMVQVYTQSIRGSGNSEIGQEFWYAGSSCGNFEVKTFYLALRSNVKIKAALLTFEANTHI
jgi:hypothetical protein